MSVVSKSYQHQSVNFDASKSEAYDLVIYIEKGTCSYAILSSDNKILAAKEFKAKTGLKTGSLLESVLVQEKFLKSSFKRTVLIVGEGQFTLVPKATESENVEGLAKELFNGHSVVETCEINTPEAIALFSIDPDLKSKAETHLGEVEFVSACVPNIHLGAQLVGKYNDHVLVHLAGDKVTITGYKQSNLVLCNAYPVTSSTDLTYFIQLGLTTCGISDQDAPVLVIGDFEADGRLLKETKSLVPSLQVPNGFLKYAFDTVSEKIPSWKYAFLGYANS